MRYSGKAILRVLLSLTAVTLGTLALIALQIYRFGNQVNASSADAAIVLGAAAWGSKPSPVYRERINEAISLYKLGRVQWIIFTGGTPDQGYPSEADVGRQFSSRHDIPMSAMLVEMESRNTWQNLERAKTLMDHAGIHSVLLVSDPLHMLRAITMARDLGIHAEPAPTLSSRFASWSTKGKFLWRETWLYTDYLLLGHPS